MTGETLEIVGLKVSQEALEMQLHLGYLARKASRGFPGRKEDLERSVRSMFLFLIRLFDKRAL